MFNYWEALHYKMYGYGLQTWEYAPQYSLRSWAYISLYSLLNNLVELVTLNKIFVFYGIRILLGLICALIEYKFSLSIGVHLHPRIGKLVKVFLVISPGMYISSTAFLPSTFAMYLMTMAYGIMFQPNATFKIWLFIFCTTAAGLWG